MVFFPVHGVGEQEERREGESTHCRLCQTYWKRGSVMQVMPRFLCVYCHRSSFR